MKLTVTKKALRDLKGLPKDVAKEFLDRMEAIAADPFATNANVERMKGMEDAWRLRKGDWRALYVVDRKAQTVSLERVKHRREVYR
jgi:mRNA interferase RelE/StbE